MIAIGGLGRRLTLPCLVGGLSLLLACQGGGKAQQSASDQTPTATSQTPAATASAAAASPQPTWWPTPLAGGPEPTGKIAFVTFRDGEREIYIMYSDGSEQTNLTNSSGPDDEPDISPDGDQLVFSSDRENSLDLYVAGADGRGLRRLDDGDGGALSPRWSPDGSRIAFSSSGTITVMNADGSERRAVFESQNEATAEPCRGGAFLGGWSPDGKRLVYYSASVTRSLAWTCIIDVDGSDLRVLSSDPKGWDVEPVWSPDGRRIAFRSHRDGPPEIYLRDLETGAERNLTNNPAADVEPEWSPDGNWIAFASMRDSLNFDIYIMRADGSDVRRLTTDEAKDAYPVWGP